MTADRHALLDLLGAVERLQGPHYEDRMPAVREAARRARRHLTRQPEPPDPLVPFRELFAGSPDTVCRTVWREYHGLIGEEPGEIECVEVPMDELRAAFDRAEADQ